MHACVRCAESEMSTEFEAKIIQDFAGDVGRKIG